MVRSVQPAEALCALVEALSDAELDTAIPTLLLSDGEVLVNEQLPLKAIVTGLAEDHVPRHAEQLLALRRSDSETAMTI